LSLLFRLLRSMPEIRQLLQECDELRSEQKSMRLKAQAVSAQMGVLEEQNRRLLAERDRLTEGSARQATEIGRQAALLADARVAGEVASQERDRVAAERDALIAERDALRESMPVPGAGPMIANGLGILGEQPKPDLRR